MPRSVPYRDLLLEHLKDPAEAYGYFMAIIHESRDCDVEGAKKLILQAVKNIHEAQGEFKWYNTHKERPRRM